MRRVRVSAAIGSGAGFAGACGNDGAAPAPALARAPAPEAPEALQAPEAPAGRVKGFVSYATRLMFKRCFGEMLSDVMFPPKPPQPSVIDGSRSVVLPIAPSVAGVFTQMRYAGLCKPNSRMT